METTNEISLKPGDIYRWRYRDPGDDGTWGRYHCCSQIAIVQPNGQLRDTYWGTGSEGRSFRTADLPKLDLTFKANLDDLEPRKEYEADYYDDADIVNLKHANGGVFYLRKGAKRSAAKMLVSAKRELESEESKIRMATSRAQQIRENIARVEAGDVSGFI